EQWLAERRKGIGGSDIATLLGINPYQSEYELWLDKTGRAGEQERTGAMQRGVWLEPRLAEIFRERTGLAVRRCGLVAHRIQRRLRATPDRLAEDGGCVEIKSMGTYSKVRTEWRQGGIAKAAYAQAQYQLLVTGRPHAWLVAYEIDHEPIIRGPVERDEPLITRMIDKALSWWADHVTADTAPPVDLSTIDDREIVLRWPTAALGTFVEAEYPAHVRALLAERAELKATEKAAKDRAKEIDQALKVMVGDAEALLVGDRPVLTLKEQPNTPAVDPALPIDHPEIDRKYIRRAKSRRIHIVKGWENS
ncbi:MAG: YqaJ viral recombinase family protein, partial [Candidatus Limnocylindria bacterium]